MQYIQQSLFDEPAATAKRSKPRKGVDYEAFVEKFKPKKTTDDCYTPAPVYDAVLAWVRKNCDIEGARILRPFYPGGDYQAEEYLPGDVVVDNPPFSILAQIVRWYTEHDLRFFLFAPYLTAINSGGRYCTTVVIDYSITYENGAKVATSFLTNMMGDIAIMSDNDLRESIIRSDGLANRAGPLPKYTYPYHVVRTTDVGRYIKQGVAVRIPRACATVIYKLDCQGDKAIFGSGYLVSDAAAKIMQRAAERAAERANADYIWELSDREREIVEKLNTASEGVECEIYE